MTLPGGFASDLSAYRNNSDCLPTLLKYSGKGDFTRREILLFSDNFYLNEKKKSVCYFLKHIFKKCRPRCTSKKLDLSVYLVLIWIFFLGRYLGSETTSHFILALHFFIYNYWLIDWVYLPITTDIKYLSIVTLMIIVLNYRFRNISIKLRNTCGWY